MIDLKASRLKVPRNLLILAAVGLGLLVVGALTSPGTPEKATPKETSEVSSGGLNECEDALGRELERVLSQVAGAGRVTVMVSLKSGPEVELAGNETRTERKTEERDTAGGVRVTTESNEQVQLAMARPGGAAENPIERKTLRPEIGGVLVVCDGAEDHTVRLGLSQAVQTLLDLPAHRVIVLPRKGGI